MAGKPAAAAGATARAPRRLSCVSSVCSRSTSLSSRSCVRAQLDTSAACLSARASKVRRSRCSRRSFAISGSARCPKCVSSATRARHKHSARPSPETRSRPPTCWHTSCMASRCSARRRSAEAAEEAGDAPAPSLTTMSTKLYSQVMAGRICSTHTSLMSAEGAPSGANDKADGAAV